MKPAVLRLTLFGFLLGTALGLLFPPFERQSAVAVSENVTLRVHPGPESRFARLTCTWHRVCSDPRPGNALDWANGANRPIFWRSWGNRSVGTGDIAWGRIIRIETAQCYEVRVRVRDVFDFPKDDVVYLHSHTWTPNWEFTIPGSPSWSFRRVEIGFTAGNEKSVCPWDGPHLHQAAEGVFWSVNWSNFLSPGTTYDVEAQANWQYQQSWTWN